MVFLPGKYALDAKNKIKALRKKRHYSQKSFAWPVTVSKTTIKYRSPHQNGKCMKGTG